MSKASPLIAVCFTSPCSHSHVSFFLKDYSYDEANPIVSIPVPASPSVSVRTSTPPASPSGQPFIDDLFDLNEEVSVNQELDKIMENQKALLKLFSDHIQQRRDSVCHCQCKAGRDQIRIGRRGSSGIFSDVGPKKGGSVTLSSEISARAASVFPNTSTEGDDFFNTRSVNCGLQREDSSKRVVSGCSNTIIGEGEFLNTSSVDGGTEISGGLSSFGLVASRFRRDATGNLLSSGTVCLLSYVFRRIGPFYFLKVGWQKTPYSQQN